MTGWPARLPRDHGQGPTQFVGRADQGHRLEVALEGAAHITAEAMSVAEELERGRPRAGHPLHRILDAGTRQRALQDRDGLPGVTAVELNLAEDHLGLGVGHLPGRERGHVPPAERCQLPGREQVRLRWRRRPGEPLEIVQRLGHVVVAQAEARALEQRVAVLRGVAQQVVQPGQRSLMPVVAQGDRDRAASRLRVRGVDA
jgi:hypothetical protein